MTGVISLSLTLLNILCVYLVAIIMFKIKSVAPIPGRSELWETHVHVARAYKDNIKKGDKAGDARVAHLADFATEFAQLNDPSLRKYAEEQAAAAKGEGEGGGSGGGSGGGGGGGGGDSENAVTGGGADGGNKLSTWGGGGSEEAFVAANTGAAGAMAAGELPDDSRHRKKVTEDLFKELGTSEAEQLSQIIKNQHTFTLNNLNTSGPLRQRRGGRRGGGGGGSLRAVRGGGDLGGGAGGGGSGRRGSGLQGLQALFVSPAAAATPTLPSPTRSDRAHSAGEIIGGVELSVAGGASKPTGEAELV